MLQTPQLAKACRTGFPARCVVRQTQRRCMTDWEACPTFFCVAILFIGSASSLLAADSVPTFVPGSDARKTLDLEVGLQWKQVPLRDGLASLCRDQTFAILLDRRVNPDLPVDFAASEERLETMMLRLAAQLKLGFANIGPVLYLGPKATAEQLATVAAHRRADATGKGNRGLVSAKASAWEELASPRQLAEQVAKDCGLVITNPAAIPHDLWPAAKWPALNATDRLTLLLAGFDLTFQLSPGEIKIIPQAGHETTMSALHSLRGEPEKAIAEVIRIFPEAKVERQGTSIIVAAPYESHEKIARLMRGEQIRKVQAGPAKKLYTLKVDGQPAGAVASTVAKALSKELKYTPEVKKKLEMRVTFDLKDVTVDELLSKALNPAGLKYILTDEGLEILEN